MAEKLRPDELQAFKAAFDMFDKNGDGTISTKVRNIDNLL
jgi:Ca2+-binding EF-hand superfamily protein